VNWFPLLLMAVVGTVVGLFSGMTANNFSHVVTRDQQRPGPVFLHRGGGFAY
jgi:hypothetical protein